MTVVRLEPATIEETVAAIAAESTATNDPLPLTIGGATAVTFDTTASGEVDSSTSVLSNGEGFCDIPWGDEGWPYRFWVADVGGEIVTFELFASDGNLDEYSTQLQPILDSIVWRDFDG